MEADIVRRPRELLRDPPRLIARQLHTSARGFIDLLGLDHDNRFVVYELKVHRTGRQTMAQILDYASWIDTTSLEELERRTSEASGENGIATFSSFPPEMYDNRRPARLVILSGGANAALSRMVDYVREMGVDIDVQLLRHHVSPLPELGAIARELGVAEAWADALDALDDCFEGRQHRQIRRNNGINYEMRDFSGTLRAFAGVYINKRKSKRGLGDIFLAIHDATIDRSPADFDRLRNRLEGIGLTPDRGNVRTKFYASRRQDLTGALQEVSDYLIPILDEVQPRSHVYD